MKKRATKGESEKRDQLPWTPRRWSHAKFAEYVGRNPHTITRWLRKGLLPHGLKFGGRDLNRLNLYAWFTQLKQTESGRKKLRQMPDVWTYSRLWRFPAWIKCAGGKPHPVLKAWERARSGGLWQFFKARYDERHKGEADKWGFLLRFVVSSMTSPPGWPNTKKDFRRFVRFIEREFYPNEYLTDLRDRLVSDDFDRKLKPHYEVARRAGISIKPLRQYGD